MSANYIVQVRSGSTVVYRRVNIEDSTPNDSKMIVAHFKALLWEVLNIAIDDGSIDVKYQTVYVDDDTCR